MTVEYGLARDKDGQEAEKHSTYSDGNPLGYLHKNINPKK